MRPGAARRMGLGYEALRAVKRDIIAVSMSMHGNDGPLSYQTGYAPCFSALAGICHLAGYEGAAEDAILARERHLEALRRAQSHLALAAKHFGPRALALELFAEELRLTQEALAGITGEFSADDLLGEIFSRFCIGK